MNPPTKRPRDASSQPVEEAIGSCMLGGGLLWTPGGLLFSLDDKEGGRFLRYSFSKMFCDSNPPGPSDDPPDKEARRRFTRPLKYLRDIQKRNGSTCTAEAINKDKTMTAAGFNDGVVVKANGALVGRFLGAGLPITGLSWNPAGDILAISDAGNVWIWRPSSDPEPRVTFAGTAMTWTTDGRLAIAIDKKTRLSSGEQKGADFFCRWVAVWCPDADTQEVSYIAQGDEPIVCMAGCPCGSSVAVGDGDYMWIVKV